MNEVEALAILRVIASADEYRDWAATELLSRLQLELPDRDWFLLAMEKLPGLRIWDPHAESDEVASEHDQLG